MPRVLVFSHPHPHPPAPRLGFSLAEVIVALLLLAVGALGVASSASFSAHLSASGRLLVAATRDVGRITDSLRTVSCASLVSGSAARPGGTIAWSVVPGARAASVGVTLTPTTARLVRTLSTDTVVPCE